MTAMLIGPHLKLVMVIWHCFHHVAFVYIMWMYMPSYTEVGWVNHVVLFIWCLYRVLYVKNMADMSTKTKTVYSQMAFLYHVTCLHQVTVTPYISKYGCYVYWTWT